MKKRFSSTRNFTPLLTRSRRQVSRFCLNKNKDDATDFLDERVINSFLQIHRFNILREAYFKQTHSTITPFCEAHPKKPRAKNRQHFRMRATWFIRHLVTSQWEECVFVDLSKSASPTVPLVCLRCIYKTVPYDFDFLKCTHRRNVNDDSLSNNPAPPAAPGRVLHLRRLPPGGGGRVQQFITAAPLRQISRL